MIELPPAETDQDYSGDTIDDRPQSEPPFWWIVGAGLTLFVISVAAGQAVMRP